MIVKKNQREPEIRSNPKGGQGDVLFTHLLTRQASDKVNLFSLIRLEPGQSIGPHTHGPDAEAIYVLSGTPSILDDGQTVALEPGDAAYCSDGHRHSLFNPSSQPAEVLAIVMK